jgi:COP9 signalosome complex subunit 7
MNALDISTTRDLEDLCINTIYASLLTGKLSPHTQTFQITSCTSRDLAPSTHDYPGMIATLSQWSKQCDLVLFEIAGRIRDVRASAAERKRADDDYEKELENMRRSIARQKGPRSKNSPAVPSGSQGNAGTQQQVLMEDLDTEFMQDIEEHEVSPRVLMTGGGESPSGRKRKLVRAPFSFLHKN